MEIISIQRLCNYFNDFAYIEADQMDEGYCDNLSVKVLWLAYTYIEVVALYCPGASVFEPLYTAEC